MSTGREHWAADVHRRFCQTLPSIATSGKTWFNCVNDKAVVVNWLLPEVSVSTSPRFRCRPLQVVLRKRVHPEGSRFRAARCDCGSDMRVSTDRWSFLSEVSRPWNKPLPCSLVSERAAVGGLNV